MSEFSEMATTKKSFNVPEEMMQAPAEFEAVPLAPGAEEIPLTPEVETEASASASRPLSAFSEPQQEETFEPEVTALEPVQESIHWGTLNDVMPEQTSDQFAEQDGDPRFTVINVESDDIQTFAREYTPGMEMVDCIADLDMLLAYMVKTERQLGVTLAMQAYGVNPIVFERAAGVAGEGNPQVVSIPVPGREVAEDGSNCALYELIDVDEVLYLSCVSESLNSDYLHQVIAEAMEAVFTHGEYIYTMVGPRPLAGTDGENQKFITTLKLNSYEMSVLLSYMNAISGVTVSYGTYAGRRAIKFKR